MKIGDKIKFDSEKQRYTVQGMNDRFIVATKPFNACKTYLYTIVDRQERIRGAAGYVLGPPCDVDVPEGAFECLRQMEEDGVEISYRNRVPLTDAEIDRMGLI